MAVTTDNIRDLLNRPRGLNEGTITEYISLRTTQVTKQARSTLYLADDSVNAVTEAQREVAIKMLVCVDCLSVLIDTVPTYYSEEDRSVYDRRYQEQLKAFQMRANEAVAMISDKGGTAFVVDNTTTRMVP